MFMILVVDDEPIVRDAVKLILTRNLTDPVNVFVASNGFEAIEIAQREMIDIVIIDIFMPGINGIQAAEKIKEILPSVKIIFLTAYNHFYYAQKAVQLGSHDFLLKPVKEQEIVEKVRYLLHKIDKENEGIKHQSELQNKLETARKVVATELFSSILAGEADPKRIAGYCDILQKDLSRSLCVIIGTECSLDSAGKLVEEVFGQHAVCLVSECVNNRIIVICASEANNELYGNILLSCISEELQNRFNGEYGIGLRIGIGGIYEGYDHIGISYHEALKAFGQTSKDQQIVYYCDMDPDTVIQVYPYTLEKQLNEHIISGDLQAALDTYRNISDYLLGSYAHSTDEYRAALTELSIMNDRTVKSYFESLECRKFHDILSESEMMQDIQALDAWMVKSISSLCSFVNSNRQKNISDLVNQSIEYIHKHYSQDVTLEKLAYHIGVTPYYLGRIFKKTTGTGFIEYLTSLRVAKASDLIKNTDKSFKEISIDTGFKSPAYFTKIFKRSTGYTASSYKEQFGSYNIKSISETNDSSLHTDHLA